MDKKEELKGLLREINQEVLDTVKASADKVEEQIAKMKEESAEMKAKLEAIENMPARKVSLPVPGKEATVDFMYKGYDLRRQGKVLEIADENVKNAIAKTFIDLIHSKAPMAGGSGATGGYLVPEEYADAVFAFARLSSVALQDADVISTNTDSFNLPKEDTGITVAWKNEAVALDASDPTFDNINLTPAKLGAYSTASNELLADTAYDIVSRLTEQYGEAIGQELDKQTFQGTEFTGILGASGINYVSGTGALSGMDFTVPSNAIAQLPSNKIVGAKFYMHRTFLHIFRSLLDKDDRPILDVRDGGFNIYGYPVQLVEQMPTDTTATSVIALFGNLKYYVIARRLGMMALESDPYGKFLEYQTRFRSVTRWDGKPKATSGFCELRV